MKIQQPYNPNLLTGKIALVIGASRGIGREIALSLFNCGAKVIAISRTQKELDSLYLECDKKIITHKADICSEEFFKLINQIPNIDILINNAGINLPDQLVNTSDEDIDKMIDLNIRAIVRLTKRVVAKMLENKVTSASIINISSQMGHVGATNRTIYCMTKHALEGFNKALAVELAPHNIRVNSIAPTFIETPLTKPMLEDKSFKKAVLDNIPLGRLGKMQDVANMAVYLASELSDMITGESIKIDGGWTAH